MNDIQYAELKRLLDRAEQLLEEAYAAHCKAVEKRAA